MSKRAVMVEMLGIDVGDDGDVGRQLQEGAVALVGLHHHPLALAHAGIGAVGVDDAAIDDGRIEPAGVEQRRDHRGGRRLAMRAADGDGLAEAHQLGQHLGAAHDRQRFRARPCSSGLVFLIADETTTTSASPRFSALVADEALDALVAQALHVGAVGLVGAVHPVAEIVQHLGDAAHADAADADEMHRADRLRHLHGRAPFLNSATDLPDAIASARSASNRAASGFPADLAAAAMRRQPVGIVHQRRRSSAASRSGESVDCGCTSAPPAAASAAALAAWSWSSACG